MADAYEVLEAVEAVTTAPDGKAIRRRFKAGVHANPTDAERTVLEEVLVPLGLAKRRRADAAKRGPGRPRKAAKRAQKATGGPSAPESPPAGTQAQGASQEGPSGPIPAQSQEEGR